MWTNALVDHGGFPLRAVMNWSLSSLATPAGHCTVSWRSSTSIWIDSHLIAFCFLSLLLPVICTMFKCASCFVFSVATIAASRWTHWCLRYCSVSLGGALFEEPVIQLYWASFGPGWCISGAMTCCCGMVSKMMTNRWRKSRRRYRQLQVKMERVTANLHSHFKLDPAVYSCTADSCRGFQQSRNLQ